MERDSANEDHLHGYRHGVAHFPYNSDVGDSREIRWSGDVFLVHRQLASAAQWRRQASFIEGTYSPPCSSWSWISLANALR